MSGLIEWLDPDEKAFWNFDYSLLNLGGLVMAAVVLFLLREPIRSALWFLSGVNLFTHEAGHLLFGFFGIELIGFLGGTLMQLIMPLAFFVSFLRRSQPRSADVCLFWIGQNLLDIGRYIADARAQLLPPLTEGEHDWAYMLGRLGLLETDRFLGGIVDLLGCALIVLCAYGLAVHSREGRKVR